jgi:hypothetical protein
MGLNQRTFAGYATILTMLVLMSVSTQAAANKAIVRAVRDGEAQFSKDKGRTWSIAKVGTVLAADYIVKTDANATADLFLGDNGPVVRVTKGTELGIDRLDVENTGIEKVIDTRLDLKSGRILGNVKKMAAASKYEVKTPVGVAGIRGTEYSISANGTVSVLSGTVVVTYIVDGVSQPPVTVVEGMQSSAPASDGAPVSLVQIPLPGIIVDPGGGPIDVPRVLVRTPDPAPANFDTSSSNVVSIAVSVTTNPGSPPVTTGGSGDTTNDHLTEIGGGF